MTCILQDYRSDRCKGCDGLCQHKLIVQGLTGDSGLAEEAGIPSRYKGVTVLTSDVRKDKPKLYGFVERYVDTLKAYIKGGDKPRSLYLFSKTPGTGKTTTAVAILNAYISLNYLLKLKEGDQPEGDEAYFLDVNELQTLYNKFNRPRVPEHIAEEASNEYYRRLEKAQEATFAVLDDIGVRSSTDGFTGDLHTVINHRMANEMVTVYTSNLEMQEMAMIFSERFYDRIREGTVPVPFSGNSFRGIKQ